MATTEAPARPEASKASSTTKERSSGRIRAISKRVATSIKTMFKRNRDSDSVLKSLSREGKNLGVDLDKRGRAASGEWKRATRRNARRLGIGRKLSPDAKKWAGTHKDAVQAEYKKLVGKQDRNLSRKDRFRMYAQAINATRLEEGTKLRKGVAEIQRSKTYKENATRALNEKTQREGRPLTRREAAGERRRVLKEEYKKKYDQASPPTPKSANGAEASGSVQTPGTTGEARPLPTDATPSPDDLRQAFDASGPDAGTARPGGEGRPAGSQMESPTATSPAPVEQVPSPAESEGPKTPRERADEIAAKLKTLGIDIEDPQIQELTNSLRENLGAGPDAMKSMEQVAQITEAVKSVCEGLGITLTPGQTAEHAKLALKTVAEVVQKQHAEALLAAKGNESASEVQSKRKHLEILMTILKALGITALVGAAVVSGAAVAEASVAANIGGRG